MFSIRFDALTLGGRIGEGSFGVVYKGTYQFGSVAIKQLQTDDLSAESQEEFEKEANIMAQLRHPNVVHFYGYCTVPKCLVMEYMPKGSLFKVLHNKGEPLDWNIRMRIATDIASGVAFLHSKQILHRDIKSVNVLLDAQMGAKLSDFGLAQVKNETEFKMSATRTHQAGGTVQWRAPELFKRKAVFTEKSDIYSLGITFWELAARQVPYAQDIQEAIPTFVKEGEREKIPPDCPAKLAHLIQQCWATDPADRPDAREVAIFMTSDAKTLREQVVAHVAAQAVAPPEPLAQQQNPAGMLIQFRGMAKPVPKKINAADVEAFLKLVAEGEQDKAESMLKANADLALARSNVMDLAGRSFYNISGFQYAVWALDWHMWTMLLKNIPHTCAADVAEQAQAVKTGLFSEHGASASWQELLDALQTYLNVSRTNGRGEAAHTQWNKKVGSLQRLLPVHVVNEYCRRDRPFEPCPDFSLPDPLPRTRNVDNGEWYTAHLSGLGNNFAYLRYWYQNTRDYGWHSPPVLWFVEADLKACRALLDTRMQQREQLFAKLSPSYQAQAKAGVR